MRTHRINCTIIQERIAHAHLRPDYLKEATGLPSQGSSLLRIFATSALANETPIAPGPNNNPALIDEVVLRAQKVAKADYLRDAVLTISGGFFSSTCISLQAEAVKS